MKNIIYTFFTTIFFIASFNSNATIVEVETNKGTFEINLFDQRTPETVANFLRYVDSGSYINTVMHRLERNYSYQLIQGGGYQFNGVELEGIDTFEPINNEPIFSNVQWTVGMAKRSGDENSATSQWYINLVDNSEVFDPGYNNGGFSVFGIVVSGFETLEAISQMITCNSTPIENLTQERCNDWSILSVDDFVVINSVVIKDSSPATASDLSPIENTLLSAEPPTSNPDSSSSSGSSWPFSLLLLIATALLIRGNISKKN